MEGEFELSSIWCQTSGSSCFFSAVAMMIKLQPIQDAGRRRRGGKDSAIKQEMWPRGDTILETQPQDFFIKKKSQPQISSARNRPTTSEFSLLWSVTACYHPTSCESSLRAPLWKWKCKQVCLRETRRLLGHRVWHEARTHRVPSPPFSSFAICPGRAQGSVFDNRCKLPRTCLPHPCPPGESTRALLACAWVSSARGG